MIKLESISFYVVMVQIRSRYISNIPNIHENMIIYNSLLDLSVYFE